jgi:hypothetical protein
MPMFLYRVHSSPWNYYSVSARNVHEALGIARGVHRSIYGRTAKPKPVKVERFNRRLEPVPVKSWRRTR